MLNESSWLSKGFAIGQANRHSSNKRSLESQISQVKSACDDGKRSETTNEKFEALFDAVIKLSQCIRLHGELSQNVINVSVATNLLEDDLARMIKNQLKLRS